MRDMKDSSLNWCLKSKFWESKNLYFNIYVMGENNFFWSAVTELDTTGINISLSLILMSQVFSSFFFCCNFLNCTYWKKKWIFSQLKINNWKIVLFPEFDIIIVVEQIYQYDFSFSYIYENVKKPNFYANEFIRYLKKRSDLSENETDKHSIREKE